MTRYLVRRTITAALVVLIVMTFLALVVHVIPGNIVTTLLGAHASPALIRQANAQMGLDHSIPMQVVLFIGHAFEGNLGTDWVTHRPVTSLIFTALPETVVLAFSGMFLAVLIGLPLGVIAAVRPGGLLDKTIGVVSVSLITMPSYVSGLLLILIFGVKLRLLPVIGSGTPGNPIDDLAHLVLPAVALAIAWIGYLARLTRSNMLEVLTANYVRTVRAFGVRKGKIFYKYALRNAAAPVVAVLGVGLGNLLGGAIFIEVIFSRPGLGTLLYSSIETRNYPVVQGCVLVIALMLICANFLADISYRLIDRRIQFGRTAAAT